MIHSKTKLNKRFQLKFKQKSEKSQQIIVKKQNTGNPDQNKNPDFADFVFC
jgi:hypothetical protein